METLIAERVEDFNNKIIVFRESYSDLETLGDVRKGYHLPVEGYEPKEILDLGCHIGLTVCDLAAKFQLDYIVGVDLDEDNVELAKINTCSIPRSVITKVAVGGKTELDFYQKNIHGSNAHKLTGNSGDIPVNKKTIDDISLQWGIFPDYIKMDIEGEEYEVLRRGGEWVSFCKCINVEIHEPYDKAIISSLLKDLGFNVIDNSKHPNSLYGVKE